VTRGTATSVIAFTWALARNWTEMREALAHLSTREVRETYEASEAIGSELRRLMAERREAETARHQLATKETR